MLVLRSFQNTNLLVLLGGLLLCLVFMIQVKQIYNNNQKYNRYLGYKEYMNEISTELKAVEKSSNDSSTYVHQLNEILSKHREKDTKNMSISHPVF
ncbi:hypothetical protein WH47_10294 [Habropoda laboriosa]|uniref:Uncharacterized protein n=1 Tax=Habropoda laboriosa TaxID=597456 RepID=A0A0L7R4M6_9HYME|nr:hypothetical protein WH47_10294 [Habropoda laboriosa]